MTFCKHCEEELTFSDEYISPKTGKKVPLDAQTMESHHCAQSLDAWRKEHPLVCNRCHKARIYFDSEILSKNCKPIPLETDTGKPHDCPNNHFRGR